MIEGDSNPVEVSSHVVSDPYPRNAQRDEADCVPIVHPSVDLHAPKRPISHRKTLPDIFQYPDFTMRALHDMHAGHVSCVSCQLVYDW